MTLEHISDNLLSYSILVKTISKDKFKTRLANLLVLIKPFFTNKMAHNCSQQIYLKFCYIANKIINWSEINKKAVQKADNKYNLNSNIK